MLGGGGGGGGGGSNRDRDRAQLRAHPDRGAWVANSTSSGHTSVGHGHAQTSRPTQRSKLISQRVQLPGYGLII